MFVYWFVFPSQMGELNIAWISHYCFASNHAFNNYGIIWVPYLVHYLICSLPLNKKYMVSGPSAVNCVRLLNEELETALL